MICLNRSLRTPDIASSRLRILSAIGIVLLALSDLNSRLSPRFLINFTESVPTGVYRILEANKIRRGMYVVFKPPAAALAIAEGRPWFHKDKLFIKQVMGLSGDEICLDSGRLTINNEDIAEVYNSDKQGMPLHPQQGCFRLRVNQLFVLGFMSPWSFDSRYFGPIDSSIIWEAFLLFSFE